MRINVYSQELTDEVITVVKESNTGKVYRAAQLILHSTDKLHHEADDDDRSAVTFWMPESDERRESIAKAFERMANIFRIGCLLLLLLPTLVPAEELDILEMSATNGETYAYGVAAVPSGQAYDEDDDLDTNSSSSLTSHASAAIGHNGASAMATTTSKMNKSGSTGTQRKFHASVAFTNFADVKNANETAEAETEGDATGNGEYVHGGVATDDDVWLIGSFNFKCDYTFFAGNNDPNVRGVIEMKCGPNVATAVWGPVNKRWAIFAKIIRYDGQVISIMRLLDAGVDLDYKIEFVSLIEQAGMTLQQKMVNASIDVDQCYMFSEASNEPSIGISKVHHGITFAGDMAFKVNDENPVD